MDTTGLRERTKDERVNSLYIIDVSGGTPPIVPTHTESVQGKVGIVSTMYDENHRNFYEARKRGEIVMGRMVLIKSARAVSPGMLTWNDAAAGGTGVQTVKHGDIVAWVENQPQFWPTLSGTINSSHMASLAVVNAYQRMNAAALCTGETLRDLDSTIQMLRSPFKGVTNLVRKILTTRGRMLKRTRRSGAKAARTTRDLLKANSDAWLEHRYGWKPLLLDIDAIAEEMHRKIDAVVTRRVARSEERVSRSASMVFDASAVAQRTGVNYLTEEVRVCVGVIYLVENRQASDIVGKFLGTRPRDLPATVWEMIPYSFVADWFVNVGSWLQAVTPDPHARVIGSWQTTITNTVRTCQCDRWWWDQPIQPSGYLRNMGYGGSSVRSDTTIERVPNPGLPSTPVLTRKPLSVLHSVDALTLSTQQILKGLRLVRH